MHKNLYLFLLLIAFLPGIARGQIAVIVNKSVAAETISDEYLSDVYALKVQYWDDETPIVLFNHRKDSELKRQFYDFIGFTASELRKIWMRAKLTGEGEPPRALKTDEEILKKVAETDGAIGFVDIKNVTDDVRVLLEIE